MHPARVGCEPLNPARRHGGHVRDHLKRDLHLAQLRFYEVSTNVN